MKIEHALEHFVVQLKANGRSPHTVAQYRRHVLKMSQYFQEHEIEEIGHEAVARFLASVGVRERADGGPRKASSANALRSSVRVFFCYLHAAGYLRANPARLVRRALCPRSVPKALSDGDRARLLAAVERAETRAELRDRALVHLLLGAGLRVGSALAAHVEDLDLDAGELRLRTMKGGGEDVAFLPREVVAILRGYLGSRAKGWLFPGEGGNRLCARQAHRRLADLGTRAEVPGMHPHRLRHTFGTAVYRSTGDLLLTARAMCHRSIESTVVYARADTRRLRDLVRSEIPWGHGNATDLPQPPSTVT